MVCSLNCNAQNIGATLGVNFANVDTDLLPSTDSKFNFTVGLYGEIMLTEKLGLQPELNLSGQGYKYDIFDGSVGSIVQWKQKLTYVNIPILANYYVASSFYVHDGPYLGILTNAERNVSGSLGILGSDNKDEFESTDFGVLLVWD